MCCSHKTELYRLQYGLYVFGIMTSMWCTVLASPPPQCSGDRTTLEINNTKGEIHSSSQTRHCYWTFIPPFPKYFGILTLTRKNDGYEDNLSIAGVNESEICTFGSRCSSNFTHEGKTYLNKCYKKWYWFPKCRTVDGEWKTCIPCIFQDSVNVLEEAKTYCYNNCGDEDFHDTECEELDIATPAALNYSRIGNHDNIKITYEFRSCNEGEDRNADEEETEEGDEEETEEGDEEETEEGDEEETEETETPEEAISTQSAIAPSSDHTTQHSRATTRKIMRSSTLNASLTTLNTIETTMITSNSTIGEASTKMDQIESSEIKEQFVRLGIPIIAVLLILLLTILALIYCKRKRGQQRGDKQVHYKTQTSEPHGDSAVSAEPLSRENEKEIVENVIYGRNDLGTGKEEVDNVLYGSM